VRYAIGAVEEVHFVFDAVVPYFHGCAVKNDPTLYGAGPCS
jgi:hypothetical protein